jgi:type II secretory ATPase GspE/PulE/Tfp pilus assembly ATPase PilB-like protein
MFRPQGCEQCYHTGYRGRAGIYEILEVGDKIQRILARTSESNEIRRAAVAEGMVPLLQAGLSKIREGRTSLEEVLRVTLT